MILSAILNSISMAIIPVTPTLASVATIAAYRAAGNELSAATVTNLRVVNKVKTPPLISGV